MWIRDPGWKKFGSGMEKSRIRDKNPGSATLFKSILPDKKMVLRGDVLLENVHAAVQLYLMEEQVQLQDLGVPLL